MTERRPPAVIERLSSFIERRPLLTFAITGLVMVNLADSGRRVMPTGSGRFTAMTWLVIALMALAPVGLFLLRRLMPPSVRSFVGWTGGLAPILYGFAAAMAGSPAVVLWLGLGLSLCLIGLLTIRARRQQSQRDD